MKAPRFPLDRTFLENKIYVAPARVRTPVCLARNLVSLNKGKLSGYIQAFDLCLVMFIRVTSRVAELTCIDRHMYRPYCVMKLRRVENGSKSPYILKAEVCAFQIRT
jgi:hypothetical protein